MNGNLRRVKHLFWFLLLFLSIVSNCCLIHADDPPSAVSADDQRREAAIADYTRQMQAANYPALFEKAAHEFNVPADILEGISFAETRWTPLQWPPGETASPDSGMPHAYGIMSLWDNDYFGHTLNTAAALIGQSPDTLKSDSLENIRGAAALLRQIYDANPKPSDAPSPDQIESWRYAVAKYTGIPQADLAARHALRVYEFMNQGYHQYGIEWPAHPVNLAPMRAEVAAIMAKAQAARGTPETSKSEDPKPRVEANAQTPPNQKQIIQPSTPIIADNRKNGLIGIMILILGIASLLLAVVFFQGRPKRR